MATRELQPFSWERMIHAVEKVKERVLRVATALGAADIPYVIAGGNAVAAWVARVDEGAVRNTADVDVIVRREDFPQVTAAMIAAGFVPHRALDVEMFLDGPNASPREAIHILFANEKVKPDYPAPVPDVISHEPMRGFRAVPLLDLVAMKLTSFRTKDRVHLLDMLEVGLIDDTWRDRLPAELAARLQQLLDNPDM